MTLNDRKCQNPSKCLLQNGTKRKKTSSYIILDPSNAFGLSRIIFFVANNGEGGGGNFRLCPILGPQGILTGPNLHNAQLDHVFYKIRPSWLLRHIIGIFSFFDKVPLWGPRGSGLDQNCTCTTRPWDQQHETINRSLWYLVTEEIEDQDIAYGQTAGQRTKGYHISLSGL